MTKSKKHQITITVTLDKACSRAVAVRAVRSCIVGCGPYYPTPEREGDPEQFYVRGAKPAAPGQP